MTVDPSLFEFEPNEPRPKSALPFVSQHALDSVVTATENYYQEFNFVPTAATLKGMVPLRLETIERILKSRVYVSALIKRGINIGREDVLTTEQHYVISILMSPTSRGSFTDRLRRAGITYPIYQNWLRQPAFKSAIGRYTDAIIEDNIPAFQAALTKKGLAGDTNAIKFLYELTGKYDPNAKQMIDFQRVVGLLLEVITRHVTDISILAKVNKDIDTIIQGGVPEAITELPNNYVEGEIVTPKQRMDKMKHDELVREVTTSLSGNKLDLPELPQLSEDFFEFKDK